jgi:hypothetical protein
MTLKECRMSLLLLGATPEFKRMDFLSINEYSIYLDMDSPVRSFMVHPNGSIHACGGYQQIVDKVSKSLK